MSATTNCCSPNSIRYADLARAAGVEMTLSIWEGMAHVFHSNPPSARFSQGYDVVALVRSKAKAADLIGVELIEGDARDPTALTRAIAGCDAVVSSLGTAMSPFREVTLLSTATRALVGVMAEQHIRQLVCITGLGAGDSRGHGGFFFDRLFLPLMLRRVYEDKDRQEDVIRASKLDWTIVRPTVLNDKPARRDIKALTNLSGVHGGTIARSDVADFVVRQLATDMWLKSAADHLVGSLRRIPHWQTRTIKSIDMKAWRRCSSMLSIGLHVPMSKAGSSLIGRWTGPSPDSRRERQSESARRSRRQSTAHSRRPRYPSLDYNSLARVRLSAGSKPLAVERAQKSRSARAGRLVFV